MSGIGYKCRGRGEAIVFLHGVGGGAESFDAQLRAFGCTHRALAWDMPGYGASDPVGDPGFPAWSEALATWLDALQIRRCILVGHSIGGMIAQTFIASHAGRVSHLVLSATSPAFGSPDGTFQRAFVKSRIGPLDEGRTMAELAAEFVPGLVGSAAPPDALREAVASMSRVSADSYRAAMEALVTFDQRATLGNIAVPCLLIAGEEDRAAPLKAMSRMAEKIPGATLAAVPGMGHLGNIEQPGTFNRLLRDFLDAHP